MSGYSSGSHWGCSWDTSTRGRFTWVHGIRHGEMPPNAVRGGQDCDGRPIYVGRAHHDCDLLPAKIIPRFNSAYVSHAGSEHSKPNFEVLCSNHAAWQEDRGGHVPQNALQIGKTRDGEPLFLGRAGHLGTLTPGKVHPSHGVLYIPYFGTEISFGEYEVLIIL